MFEKLKYNIVNELKITKTQDLIIDFIGLVDEYGLISEKLLKNKVLLLLNFGELNSDSNDFLKNKLVLISLNK